MVANNITSTNNGSNSTPAVQSKTAPQVITEEGIDVDFDIDIKEAIRQLIQKQAGTVFKGGEEGFQNAIDAIVMAVKANPSFTLHKIAVQFLKNAEGKYAKLIIEDTGCGMTQEVILDNFRVFCKKFKVAMSDMNLRGKFNMGRGQIFNMGETTFETNEFIIEVDILNKGLKFNARKVKTARTGTKLTVNIYPEKQLDNYDGNDTILSWKKALMVKECDIEINGEKIAKPSVDNAWVGDGVVCIPNEQTNSSRIYLRGIYVCDSNICVVPSNVLVEDLEVNYARNEFERDDKYKKFEEQVKQYNLKEIKDFDHRKAFTKTAILVKLLDSKAITPTDLDTLKCIQSYEGNVYWSPKFIREKGGQVYDISALDHDERYQAANIFKNEYGGLLVELTGQLPELAKLLGINIMSIKEAEEIWGKIWKLLHKEEKQISESEVEKEMSNQKRGYLRNVEYYNSVISEWLGFTKRAIEFVQGGSAEMYTNGSTYIRVNIECIDFYSKKNRFAPKIVNTLIHEYCHTGNSIEGSHSSEFYERYHDYLTGKKYSKMMEEILASNFWKIAGYIGEDGKVKKKGAKEESE